MTSREDDDFGMSDFAAGLQVDHADPAAIRRRGDRRGRRRRALAAAGTTGVAAACAVALFAAFGPLHNRSPRPADPAASSTSSRLASKAPSPVAKPSVTGLLPDPTEANLPTAAEYQHARPGDLVRLSASAAAFEPQDNVCIENWTGGNLDFTMSYVAAFAPSGQTTPTDYVSSFGFATTEQARAAYASLTKAYTACAASYGTNTSRRGVVVEAVSGPAAKGRLLQYLNVVTGTDGTTVRSAEVLLIHQQNRLLWAISYRDGTSNCATNATAPSASCGLFPQSESLAAIMLR